MFHGDSRRPVASHGVADQAPARSSGNRAVAGVGPGHDVFRDVALEVSRGDRARVHRAVVHRLRVGQDDDHLLCALREGTFEGLRHVYLGGPLLSADGVAVQGVDDRIAPGLLLRVARGQEDDRIAIDGVALQVAFQGLPVDLDPLHGGGLGARDDRRHFGLHLRGERRGERDPRDERDERHSMPRPRSHVADPFCHEAR